MATLKSIELSGWKSIKHAKVDLGPINVLIGANGSGKSNFISFFKLLNEMINGRLQEYVARAGGANSLLYYGSKTTPAVEFELVVSGLPLQTEEYRVSLTDAPPDTLVFAEEKAQSHDRGCHTIFPPSLKSRLESDFLKWSMEQGFGALGALLRSCLPYHINDTSPTALIRRYGYIEDNRVLRSDAANLAAVLHRIRILTPRIYERIVRTIRQINPRFGDFVLEPQTLNPNQIMLNWKEKGQDTLFWPHQLSDGTLRVMALVTLLLQPEAELPALLVLDEPELGLHPYAIGAIAGLLQAASHHCQVIISTQSTQLLNEFDVGDVIVVNRPGEETTFSRLDEAQLAGWLEDYDLAELWQKNVLGGGPH